MILAFAAKRAIIDRVSALVGSDLDLADVQVSYSYPGEPERRCVYGGTFSFVQRSAIEEPGLLMAEVDAVELYVRIYRPGDDVRVADADAEAIMESIATDLATNSKLAGALSVTGVSAGEVSYTVTPNPEPAVIIMARLIVTVEGNVEVSP